MKEKHIQRTYFLPPLVDSHPNYVFLDCGESTVGIQDIFSLPTMMLTCAELIVAFTEMFNNHYLYISHRETLKRQLYHGLTISLSVSVL